MRRCKKVNIWVTMLVMAGLLGGCVNMTETSGDSSTVQEQSVVKQDTQLSKLNSDGRYEIIGNYPIADKESVYDENYDNDVVTMYLTVRQGNATDGTNHTWEEINTYSVYDYEEMGVERYQVEGLLQVGDEDGPVEGAFGFGEVTPNATVSIRGQSSSIGQQKNYKIRIKDNKGTYEEQQIINLNKHQSEGLRFRNKLCYDLMQELPDMLSARTQFVHLYVRDLTQGKDTGFKDYGLYTQVEQINKTYLERRELDKDGHLYKVNFFEFDRYEDVIMKKNESAYDVDKFEYYLEIKGNDDHDKLIDMLEELNDEEIPIEETFAKWFDEDNVFSWMAFHILAGNIDTQSRNCFLYSPLNVDKWYFISWDNDASFRNTEYKIQNKDNTIGWEVGVSNYWGNKLFRRVLKIDAYREKLHEKVLEYKTFLSEEKLSKMAKSYNQDIEIYLKRFPDIEGLPITLAQRKEVLEQFPKEVEQNYQYYLQSLENPQPFFIGVLAKVEEGFSLRWDTAYSFEHRDITYTLEVAKDYGFTNPIFRAEDLYSTYIEMPLVLEPGQYFIRVMAKDELGNHQYAFDYYSGVNGKVYGTKCFYILEDGSIAEDVYDKE